MAAKVKHLNYSASTSAYWAGQARDEDATFVSTPDNAIGCTRVTLKWTRNVPAGVGEDLMMSHFWFGLHAGGGVYSILSGPNITTMEAELDAWWTNVKTLVSNDVTLVEYSWQHFRGDLPRTDDGKAQKPNPPVKITVKSVAGTSAAAPLPHQVACNLTQRTASRKHWGRTCLPGLATDSLQADYGRFATTTVDNLANWTDSLQDGAQLASCDMGVWSQWKPAFLTCKQLEVDDVPDIQRRRRAKRAAYRKLIV